MRILFILSLLSGGMLYAQSEASFSAEINKDTCYAEEVITLTYTVKNMKGDFTAPDFQGFQVFGPNTSMSSQWINGVGQSTAKYTYYLKPMNAGDLVIDGAQLDSEEMITLENMNIHVLEGEGEYQSAGRLGISAAMPQDSLSAQDSLKIKLRRLKTKKI